jgi:hypothetical protein
MRWITGRNVKVDRVACPWLIRRFIDPQAEFLFAPENQLLEIARREGSNSLRRKSVSRSKTKPPGRTLYVRSHSRRQRAH